MAEKIITLRNDTLFEFPEDGLFYRVVQGTAYLFAIEKLKNGLDSARTEIAIYNQGDYILCLPSVKQDTGTVRFVLTGTLNSQIEKADIDSFSTSKGKEELEKALSSAFACIKDEAPENCNFSEILSAKDKKKQILEYALHLSEELCLFRRKKNHEESLSFSRRMQSTQKAFCAALEEISDVAQCRKKTYIQVDFVET